MWYWAVFRGIRGHVVVAGPCRTENEARRELARNTSAVLGFTVKSSKVEALATVDAEKALELVRGG